MKTDYSKAPYSRLLIPNDDGSISADVLEFPGCFAQGDTPDEAFRNLEDAAEAWVDVSTEQGLEIPEPVANYGYSGKIMLRLPRGLHRRAAQMANREGVSLNQYLVTAIAARLGAEDFHGRLADLIERQIHKTLSINVLLQVSSTVPGGTDRMKEVPKLIHKCTTENMLPIPFVATKEFSNARI